MIFGKLAHSHIKSGKLAHFDIKEGIETYKRNTQKQKKERKTTVNC